MGLKKTIMMLLLVSQIICMHYCEASEIHFNGNKETLVRITNFVGLSHNLAVHCKSAQDDIGLKELPPMNSFEFKFRTRVFGNTLFTCVFEWVHGKFNFIIYNQKKAKYSQNCWVIKPNGPCLCDCKNTTCTYDDCKMGGLEIE